ncbi:MAG TPA: permease [Gaiellaceae bacterium]|nr:permease [Gaiellaceae bacterium]
MSAIAARARFAHDRHPLRLLGAATLAWFALYHFLLPFWDHLLYGAFALPRGPHWADALHFFLYDSTKILLLLVGIIFAVRVLRSFLSIERTRALLGGKREGLGNVAAAGLGVATPFCSCSAVPAFIGFVAAGVPLGVTLSFLIASPMVNEIAVVLLYGLFGFKITALYIGSGLAIAIVAGAVLGRMRLERYIEPFVLDAAGNAGGAGMAEYKPSWAERIEFGVAEVKTIVGKVWLYVLAGIALGAAIHGWVPADFFARVAGAHNPFAVPFAVLLGIPLYSNAAGVLPLVEALHAKGVAMGTVLAFMMAVVALSAPEMILLRRVLRPQLLGIYVAVVAVGIVATGYLFNAIL